MSQNESGMSESPSSGKVSAWVWPVVGALVCLGLGYLSGSRMEGGGGEWYEALRKPAGNPPPWVFAPVWSVLYVMMGVALGRLIHRKATGAIVLFVIQLMLNLAWTPVFFGLQAIGWALVILFGLWGFLALTIRSAEKWDTISSVLLLPYLFWVMYATYLNAAIGWLNR